MGIEPTYLAWKANVLPLNYTRIFNCFAISQAQDRFYNKIEYIGKEFGEYAKDLKD